MNTYDNSNDISGLDWQTGNNFSTWEPSFRESDGMASVDDHFSRGDIGIVDAVFDEGFLRGLNFAANAIKATMLNKPKRNNVAWDEACEKAMEYVTHWRDSLLAHNNIEPTDDEALYSSTPFIDELDKKGAL